MSSPASRSQLKDYCLRRLGFPVIQLNLDDDQVEDRIDDALHKFQEYHFDGTRDDFFKHQITQTDIDNGYVAMDDTVIGVARVFPLPAQATSISGQFNMFDITYQIRLNELYDFTSADYVYFTLAQQHLRTLEMLFIGEQPFRFNRYDGKLYIDMNWKTKVTTNNFILAEVRRVIDGTAFWGSTWLKNYTTACIKEQWGSNIKKFGGVQLPGGIILNGQQIYDEAVEEKEKLNIELRDTYEQPVGLLIG